MSYLIIAEWDSNFHPTRTAVKQTVKEAEALVKKLTSELPDDKKAPNAFYVSNPDVSLDLIVVDPDTKTITVNATTRDALAEILRLEAQITPRRTREAILGTDNGWLANQESLIAIERNKLGE